MSEQEAAEQEAAEQEAVTIPLSDSELKLVKNIDKVTKRGFDPSARLKSRGLRRGTITLYLDEEVGGELGEAIEVPDILGKPVKRRRGVLGRIADLEEERERLVKLTELTTDRERLQDIEKELTGLRKRAEQLKEKLESTGLTLSLQAVPKVIRNKSIKSAPEYLGITTEEEEEARAAEVGKMGLCILLTEMVLTIRDNESGVENNGISLQEVLDMEAYLPPSQWARLDQFVEKVQFIDTISASIEAQEDFS